MAPIVPNNNMHSNLQAVARHCSFDFSKLGRAIKTASSQSSVGPTIINIITIVLAAVTLLVAYLELRRSRATFSGLEPQSLQEGERSKPEQLSHSARP